MPWATVFDRFDSSQIGGAVVNVTGEVENAWGLARRVSSLAPGVNVFESQLGLLAETVFRGFASHLLLSGVRLLGAPFPKQDPTHMIILVIEAAEEYDAWRRAALSERKADALKRIGKALTMNQTQQTLSVAATHAIASAAELSAVFLWVRGQDSSRLSLAAHVGASRTGLIHLEELSLDGEPHCLAELVAQRQRPLTLARVSESPLAAEIEGKLCYLPAGGVIVLPLIAGNRLLGVLELVGREDDPAFLDSEELFSTIGEHLSLALHSAILFEATERLASHDALTGIANHRTMQEYLATRMFEAERKNEEMGVVMIDVDHFRRFNEEEGHDAGDAVLRRVAQSLSDGVRPYDLAARYGGEEFAVILPHVTESSLLEAAERLRQGICRIEHRSADGSPRVITASLGVALFPAHASTPSGLLKAADLALYASKRNGRNRVTMYSPDIGERGEESRLDFSALREWFTLESLQTAMATVDLIEPSLQRLTKVLKLTPSRQDQLRRAVFVAQLDESTLSQIKDREWGPSRKLVERANASDDGSPRIVKVTAVLLAVAKAPERRVTSSDWSGRLDPELVAILQDRPDAA
ncbi:MAG: sensor domain-containing diguanylate cyclase [Fimbriimonadaceae bacterium]|nr:sensor domain-containing diguanylate cyclase [Fimbriimonadaceae bacterium]